MTKEHIPAVFPFELSTRESKELFRVWLDVNRKMVHEQYGHISYVGPSVKGANGRGYIKSWSYYEVDATIIDEHTIEFQTYDMHHSYYGGRGMKQEKFVHTFASIDDLDKYVFDRKMFIATMVYEHRREVERERLRNLAIQSVYVELFLFTKVDNHAGSV